MKKAVFLCGLLAAVAVGPAAQAAVVTYKANLTSTAESPPVQSQARGTAAVNADPASKEVSWRVDYSGLSGPAVGAHIHCGAAAGGTAGIAVPLGKAPNFASPLTGSAKMTDAQFAELQAGKCYVNIHTANNKAGEIRGQLMP